MAANAKENIMKRIKEALLKPVPLPFPDREKEENIFVENNEDLAVLFAKEFKALQGNFCFCENKEAFKNSLDELITEKNWTKIFYK